jgi:hypothetical protein
MNLMDAAQSAYLICGIPTVRLAIFTSIMLWISRPEHRSPRHFILYFVVSLAIYFLFFVLGIWFSGTFIAGNLASR